MRIPALILGFTVACVAMLTGCGDNLTRPQPHTKEFVAFGFLPANNSQLSASAPATISGDTISATVPFGTDVTALVASFETTGASITLAGVPQESGVTANNFSASVTYRVTAEDSTTHDYAVTVKIAPATAKQLTSYAFLTTSNAGLGADVTATINGTAIAATVPFGTDITTLVATFTTTGASVTVAGTAQVSGTTANNFTAPVAYTVTAADGSTQIFIVTITVAPNRAKAITAYSFLSVNNPGLRADVIATINGTSIAATVPFGTNVTALVATFTTTGANVTVAGAAQVSGITAHNLTSPVTYRVTAADGSTQDFIVTVTVAVNPAKAITAYAFLSVHNPGLGADVIATLNGTSIAATVPFGTDTTALVATFATTGASVTVGGTAQVNGTTANDFTSPVAYTVTASDGTTAIFTVTVTIAPITAKAITAYRFLSVHNPGLGVDVTATITGTAIAATVPFGTDVTALVATFATTGTSVMVASTAQVSSTRANDFTSPVAYTVTAGDGSTQVFTVTLTVALNRAKAITAYSFLSTSNPGIGADITATITGTAIAVTVPFGTDVTALIATFSTTGASVTVAGTAQVSGITTNNCTSPVTYRVTAGDGSTLDHTVTVTVARNPAKDITAYAFLSASNSGLSENVTATITGTAIAVTVPFGTDVTALVATFSTTGASVTVVGTAQVSSTTANNFQTPVDYTVAAADGTTAIFTVTVIIAPSRAKDITAFSFRSADNPGLAADITATITGTAITAAVPFGPDLTALVATFTTTGVTVQVGATTQTNGTTQNDFTTPVVYTVTAADDTTQNFTVTITPPSVMVVRVGDGATALSDSSTAVFLEKRSVTDGSLIQTIALPTTGTPFTMTGNATSEGELSRSVDGRYLTLAGYAAVPGIVNIAATPNVTVGSATNRVVARIDATGAVDASTLLFNAFNAGNPRAATSVDGNSFWVSGTSSGTTGGIHFVPLGSTGTTRVLSAPDDFQWVHVFDGQLYGSSISGATTTGVFTVGAGLPTMTGAVATPFVNTMNAAGFVLVDRNPVVTGLDTLYVAIDAPPGANCVNVQKWTFDGTTWTQDASFLPTLAGANDIGTRGLAAWLDGTGVHVIATTNEALNRLVSFVDDGSTATPTVTPIAQTLTNTAFRGVALSPEP